MKRKCSFLRLKRSEIMLKSGDKAELQMTRAGTDPVNLGTVMSLTMCSILLEAKPV